VEADLESRLPLAVVQGARPASRPYRSRHTSLQCLEAVKTLYALGSRPIAQVVQGQRPRRVAAISGTSITPSHDASFAETETLFHGDPRLSPRNREPSPGRGVELWEILPFVRASTGSHSLSPRRRRRAQKSEVLDCKEF